MVLYGAEHLTERAQAYDLLERAARLHWGWDRLPELAREEQDYGIKIEHRDIGKDAVTKGK